MQRDLFAPYEPKLVHVVQRWYQLHGRLLNAIERIYERNEKEQGTMRAIYSRWYEWTQRERQKGRMP